MLVGRTLLEGAGERKRERGGAYLLRSKLLCCEREIALFVYSGILFVRQVEVPRGEFICATFFFYEYTNKKMVIL